MKKTSIIYLIVAALILSSCASKAKKERTITLSGAFALYPLVIKWTEEYKKVNPEVRFNISGGGAGKGLADALAEVVDLGMFSREITQAELERGTWYVGLTIDAVIPGTSADNPYLAQLKQRGLSREEFKAIYIDGTITTWNQLLELDEEAQMSVYTRADACGAAETWAKYIDAGQEDLLGIGLFGDPGLAEALTKDPLSIGYNNTIYVYDVKTGKKRPGLEVIPIDINGNGVIDAEEDFYEDFSGVLDAIAKGVYPSPPARELYFVAKGKPQKQAVIDFIKWTLTEGQQYVTEAGYVPISQELIQNYLELLN